MAKTKTRLPRADIAIIPAPDGAAIFEREVLDPVRRDYIQARMLGLGFVADKGMATDEELAKLAELRRVFDQKQLLPPALTKTLLLTLPEPAPELPARFGTGRDRVTVEAVPEPAGGHGWQAVVLLAAGAGIMAGWGWIPFMGFVSGVICTLVARAVAHG